MLRMKWGKLTHSVAAVLVLSVCVMSSVGQVSAQANATTAPLNLTTSPLPVSLTTQPGRTVTHDIRIKNSGTQTETLKVGLLKFGASGDEGQPELLDRQPSDKHFDWVTFSQDTFKAEPNVWMTIRMTINVPKDAAFGYYYAATFTRAKPANAPAGAASSLQGGVATLVLLNVDVPGAKRTADITSFTATQKVYEFLPATFRIKMRNNGNVHVSPTGNIFIKRGDKQVGIADFNAEHGNILPGTNRIFEVSWRDGFPHYQDKRSGDKVITGKDGKPVKELVWDVDDSLTKLRFGKYTAHLTAVYDDGKRDIASEATVSFWVIPWRIIAVGAVLLVLLGVGSWVVMRKVVRRLSRRNSKSAQD